MSKVTFVMPNRNKAQFLPDAILALQKQTLKDIEIVIIDDDSTDDCNVLPDGGEIINGLCLFLEFLAGVIEFIVDIFTLGIEGAVLNLINEWIETLVNAIKVAIYCLFEGTFDALTGFVDDVIDCFESGFTDCDVSFSYSDECEAFFSNGQLVPPVPQDPSESTPNPSEPGYPSFDFAEPGELLGVCCASDGQCSGSVGAALDGEDCAKLNIGDVHVFVPSGDCATNPICGGGFINVRNSPILWKILFPRVRKLFWDNLTGGERGDEDLRYLWTSKSFRWILCLYYLYYSGIFEPVPSREKISHFDVS